MKVKGFIALAVASALCLASAACGSSGPGNESEQNAAVESTSATAGAGAITFSYPKEWVLLTEADFDDLENMQIMGQTPAAFCNVGPEGNSDISFSAYCVPDFPFSYEEFKGHASSDDQLKSEIITADGHEAVRTDVSVMQPDMPSGFVSYIVYPNIDGKITSFFLAIYPSVDAECIAVADSVKISSKL